MEEIVSVRNAAEARRRAHGHGHKECALDLGDAFDDDEPDVAVSPSSASHELAVHTQLDGYNSGCVYRVRAASVADHDLLIKDISRIAAAARERSLAQSRFSRTQERVRIVFTSNPVQKFIALLILVVRFVRLNCSA